MSYATNFATNLYPHDLKERVKMKPQKHAKEIIAWANGAVIQYKTYAGVWTYLPNPAWDENAEYRASIAEVEGKPVYVGDVLYKNDGMKLTVVDVNTVATDAGYCLQILGKWEALSWNPPKPKTLTVELLREDAEAMAVYNSTMAVISRIADVCKEALK